MSMASTTHDPTRPPETDRRQTGTPSRSDDDNNGPTGPPDRTARIGDQLRGLTARLHFYAGLFVAPFLVIAAVSGALYALAPTLETLVYQDELSATPTESPAALATQIEAARDRVPGLSLVEVWPADDPGTTTRVLFRDDSLPDGQSRVVFVDPADASVTGELTSYSGLGELPVRSWISGLHRSLHLGAPGEVYAELAASWLFVLVLSGLFLWWRRTRGGRGGGAGGAGRLEGAGRTGDAGRPRRRLPMLTGLVARPGSRRKMMSLHATVGTWLAVAMLGIAATGLTWSTYAGGNIDSVVEAMGWRSQPLRTALPGDGAGDGVSDNGDEGSADAHAGHGGHPGLETDPVTLTAQAPTVLVSARQAGLDGPLRMIAPTDGHTAWSVSQRWEPWVFSSDAVAVNGADGQIVDALPFADLSPYSKLSSWGIYLHMGIMFGLPLQIALAITALGVVWLAVTGYRMWWRRRPTRGGAPAALGRTTGHSWTAYAIAAAGALGVGLVLPVFGVSVAVFVVVDIIVTLRARRTRAAVATTSPVSSR